MDVITDVQGNGLTRALAEQARTLTFADIPDETRTWARHCVLDYIACGVAGASDELTEFCLRNSANRVVGSARQCLARLRACRLPRLR